VSTTLRTRPAATPAKRRRRASRSRVALLLGALLAGAAVLLATFGLRGDPAPVAPRAVEVEVRPPTRAPAFPAVAAEPTEAGATAFVPWFFDVVNWSLSSGDTDQLASASGAGCAQCSGWLLGVARWQAEQAQLDGGLTVPLELAVGPFRATEPVSFAATFLTSPATLTRPDGTVEQFPGGRTRGGVTVLWVNDRWQVTEVVLDTRTALPRP
jgi:hypothetical protein